MRSRHLLWLYLYQSFTHRPAIVPPMAHPTLLMAPKPVKPLVFLR